MRSRRVLFAAVSTVALLIVSATAATAAERSYRNYVALGDSYTSGPLIPLPRLVPLFCGKSTQNYPSLLAAALRVRSFTDISCGGADTTDMTQRQNVTLGSNPPQFSALHANTDLVTVGIGGNDYGVFGTLVGTCPELRAGDPTGNPCQDRFTVDGVDTVKAKIAATGKNVEKVLAGIHARSPRADVLVIGYPRIAPESGYCPDILPFAEGDYAWLNDVEKALNSAIEKAVAADGKASFVDTFGPSAGHDACAPRGAAWINGQHTKLLAAAAYHPYRTGMVGVTGVILRHLR
ncbi:SGNH/GDSL hydrolase family protein [Amycolatopsis regifaucium]|uniref:GDSL family lipase n=1 Tax=Amycolatopsis regifaucium TaxID=546365 RepID=A0A154MGF1_9PSEU|nr:SGNH/GDSL hydrolase family protein [Amycolatopsis regifaucium]KZB83551.1 GDSL family lipase [Amycolatopsis regifaucium]OKA03321.1 GDSL family lipase [Amycolatopsis regifaucium]SFJ61370.1 GDSL-like Lipase/Acylhydrolase family protein [Amycolatopsis regifaucium]